MSSDAIGTRHACDQGDGLEGYTWTEHDLRDGGVQVLNDTQNNVQITTEWLKVPGGDSGGSWAARIKGKPLQEGEGLCHVVLWLLLLMYSFFKLDLEAYLLRLLFISTLPWTD